MIQAVLIGLGINELVTYNIGDYFVGPGGYYDGARSADHLREVAVQMSVVMFFLTAISLIVLAVVAGFKSLMILTVALVGFDVLFIVDIAVAVTQPKFAADVKLGYRCIFIWLTMPHRAYMFVMCKYNFVLTHFLNPLKPNSSNYHTLP